MVERCAGRHTIGLAVHATLAIWPKATLSVAGVVLMIVWVVVVWVIVTTGITLSVGLGLRARCTRLMLSLLSLLCLLLSLGSRVRCRVAGILVVVAAGAKARLGMNASTALRILAQVIRLLRSIVATKSTLLLLLLSRDCVLSLGALLLTKVLAVVIVRVSLVRGIVGGVVAGGRAEWATRLLRLGLRSLGREVIERRLSRRGALLVERIQRLLGSTRDVLSSRLTKSSVLLSLRSLRLRVGCRKRQYRGRI